MDSQKIGPVASDMPRFARQHTDVGQKEPESRAGGSGCEVVPDPVGQGRLAQAAGREPHDDLVLVRPACNEIGPVEPEEQAQEHERRALVSVGERMVSGNAPGVGCGERGQVGRGIAVREQ